MSTSPGPRDEQTQPNYSGILCTQAQLRNRINDLSEKVRVDTFVVPATTEVTRQMKETKVKDKSAWQILEGAG